MNKGNVNINKTQEMIKGFTFGEIVPSEGIQLNYSNELPIYQLLLEEIRKHLLKQSLIHCDDTVIMVNQHRTCLHFYGDEHLALYKSTYAKE